MTNDRPSLMRLDEVEPLPLLRELMQRGEADPATITLLRLQWLRQEHPGARVETAVVPIEGRLVTVQARIAVPDGWSVSTHAAVDLPENPSGAMEQAEQRALARALDLAGYAMTELPTARAEPVAEEPAPVTTREPAASSRAPAARNEPEPIVRSVNRPAVVDALRKVPSRSEPAPQPAPEPAAARPQRGDFTVVHDRRSPASQPPASADDGDEDETPLEDYSWTAFWRWAKAQGLNNQAEIAEVIGQPVGRMTPAEIRAALREHGVGD